jgi:hypothetical protein
MKRKIYAITCFVLFLVLFALAWTPCVSAKSTGFSYEAGPMLFSPTTENIDLTGKDYLEFRWWRVELPWTDHFIFKLYKGYNTTADNLIFKQDYSGWDYPVKLPSSQFEVGQVYTWVLQQVFNGGRKSDKSFSSFKIIKK